MCVESILVRGHPMTLGTTAEEKLELELDSLFRLVMMVFPIRDGGPASVWQRRRVSRIDPRKRRPRKPH